MNDPKVSNALLNYLNWEGIMSAPRYAGGHEDVMNILFQGAKVVLAFIQDEYQGYIGYIYKMPYGKYVIINDSFGSCGGCDSWEEATDEEVRQLVKELAISYSQEFGSLEEVKDYLREESEKEFSSDWAKGLLGNWHELKDV